MKSRGAAALAAALACALSGCLGAGQSDRYRSMREELARVPSGAPQEATDRFAGSASLERGALVSAVLERNPSLVESRAAWQAALARYPQETALPDPMFGYAARPQSFGSNEVDAGNEFTLAQPLLFPGKLALRGERALAEADAARSDLARERVRLAAASSALFDEYWLAERTLVVNESQLALLDQARASALARYASGAGPQQDVLAADTERAMLEHRGIELESGRRISAERINLLLHRDPRLPVPAPALALPEIAAHELDDTALVKRALETRAELRAQAAQVRAREADVSLARREFWPDFTLRAGYDTSWQETPLRPMVGIELNVPLQLEKRRAALEEADARLTRERSRLLRLEDQVRFEVIRAVERVREAQHLCEVSGTRLLPTARARASAVRSAFTAGRTSLLELLEAERAVRSAEEAELAAQAALASRSAELERALGNDPALQGQETP